MKLYYVYIVECSDGSFYTGFTSNLEKRIFEHNSGRDPDAYTFKRRPVELKWVETFTDPNHAITTKKQIKGWSRSKKIAVINGEWEKLVELSRNKYKKAKNDEKD